MPDKPGHILEISDSLGRQVDKAREGKAPPPPIEAFLSDGALREIERATKSKDEPVRASQLQPITRGQANARTTFNGETLPRAPSMRRVIPAPFQRPRIEIGAHGKTWQWVFVEEVAVGDIVPDVGQVTEIYEHVVHKLLSEVTDALPELEPDTPPYILEGGTPEDTMVAVGLVLVLTGMGGEVKAFRPGSSVQVFRKAQE